MRTLREHSRDNSYLVVFICLGCLTFLSACGGSGGGSGVDSLGDSSGTGTVSFSLTLQDQGTVQALSIQAADNSATQFDCETNKGLIAKIKAGVYDENDALLAEGGPWNCEDHQGIIHGVDAGDGRVVEASAEDESGETIFWGKSEPITIRIDQVTNAGNIDLKTVNRPPELNPIGNREINEGELIEFDLFATDPDGDRLLFEIGNKPADAEFAFEDMEDGTAIANFSWMPSFDSAGNYKVMFKVTDNGKPSLSDFEEITISVGNVPLPPVLNPIGDREVLEGEQLKFDINATDPDSINLRFEMGNKPADASFMFQNFGDGTGTATFSWTPDFGASGEYPVIFKVFDDSPPPEGPLSDFEEIKIVVGDVCRAPVLDPIVPPDGKEGELIEFTVTAKDSDLPDDVLSFSCISDTEGFDCEKYFNPSTQRFSWTPGFESVGIYQVRFIVTDACPGPGPQQDFEDVTITVGETCRPPTLEPIGSKNVNENEELRFTITATDPDLPNDALSFSCVSDEYSHSEKNLCEFFDPSTRVFTWTPGYSDQREYTVRFIVTDACEDPGPQQDFEDVKITVGNTNRPPVFKPIDPFIVELGQEIRFTVVADDPDSEDILTIDADLNDLPAGAAFIDNGNRTGTFSWTPTSGDFPRKVSSLTFLFSGDEDSGGFEIEINDGYDYFNSFNEINNTTIGGASVSVTFGLDQDRGKVSISGALIETFEIGGEELWVDDFCYPTGCVDFEDLDVGTTYRRGESFIDSGAYVDVYNFSEGSRGSAIVENNRVAGGSGNEIRCNDVVLSFGFGYTVLFTVTDDGNPPLRDTMRKSFTWIPFTPE